MRCLHAVLGRTAGWLCAYVKAKTAIACCGGTHGRIMNCLVHAHGLLRVVRVRPHGRKGRLPYPACGVRSAAAPHAARRPLWSLSLSLHSMDTEMGPNDVSEWHEHAWRASVRQLARLTQVQVAACADAGEAPPQRLPATGLFAVSLAAHTKPRRGAGAHLERTKSPPKQFYTAPPPAS